MCHLLTSPKRWFDAIAHAAFPHLYRYYMILDEAQNIKNFQSQRWQTLLHFNTERRLLLTGTPLQNSLMVWLCMLLCKLSKTISVYVHPTYLPISRSFGR